MDLLNILLMQKQCKSIRFAFFYSYETMSRYLTILFYQYKSTNYPCDGNPCYISLVVFFSCTATVKFDSTSEHTQCKIENRPTLASIYLNIFAYFGAGIMMSSWAWTKASKDLWKRFLRKLVICRPKSIWKATCHTSVVIRWLSSSISS